MSSLAPLRLCALVLLRSLAVAAQRSLCLAAPVHRTGLPTVLFAEGFAEALEVGGEEGFEMGGVEVVVVLEDELEDVAVVGGCR